MLCSVTQITAILQRCDGKNYPIATVPEIHQAVDKIDQGRCGGNVPAPDRSFTWFWRSLRRIMAAG